MGVFPHFFLSLAGNVPIYLAWLVGIAIAVVRYQRHPRVSLFLIIGLIMLLLLSLLQMGISLSLPMFVERYGWGAEEISAFLAIVGGLDDLVSTAGWVLVLVAALGWRGAPSQQGMLEAPSVAGSRV